MAYGTVKVDNVTFTYNSADATTTFSGFYASTTNNLTLSGTASAATFTGTTANFTNVNAQNISVTTITGTTASFTSGVFTSLSGTTHTITSGVFASGTAALPSISFVSDPNTGVFSPGADQLAVATNGTSRLSISSAGEVTTTNEKLNLITVGRGGGAVATNTAVGTNALLSNSTGARLTAVGDNAGTANTASDNVFLGYNTGAANTSGTNNTAVGSQALATNISGSNNTAVGYTTLLVSTGSNNTGVGGGTYPLATLANNTTGGSNTAVGTSALSSNTTGSSNICFGKDSGSALTTGSNNTIIGSIAGTAGLADTVIIGAGTAERLRIDSSGNVGIGNSSPGAKLDVSGDVIFNGGGTQFPIQFANAFTPNAQRADLFFSANATSNNALRVGTIASNGGVTLQGTRQSDSSQKVNLVLNPDGGSVGIGVTSPGSFDPSANQLVVGSGTGDQGVTLYAGTASSSTINFADGTASTAPYVGRILYQHASNAMTFHTNGGTEAVRIDSSQRLLVGTSTARTIGTGNFNIQSEGLGAEAGISTTRNSNSTSSSNIRLVKTRGTAIGSTTIVQSGDSLGDLGWWGTDGTNAIQAASIFAVVDGTPGANDMPGRLVFSTTVDGGSSPTGRAMIDNRGVLHTFAAAGGDGHLFMTGENAGTTYYLFAGFRNVTAVSGASGTKVFQVFTNGDVQNTNNSYGAISDIKLKENIVDATSQWNDLKALQVRKYNFKEGQTHTQIGLVAQEAELVSPGLVYETPDRDAEGNDLGTVTKSVNYSVLYMKAVKALQEAMERIETLEQRLTAAGID